MSDGYRIISRWFFDVCVSEALESFRNGDYAFFANITKHIESLVVLPMEGRGDTVLKLRFMQFLSRINNGDKLDLTYEEPKTPLESALAVLESLCRELGVPRREQQRVHNAITEMLIIVCIKSGEFEKAEEILHRHFSTAADSTGKKKLLVKLIRRRRSCHSVLQLSSYSDFKQDMLEFIERLYRVPEPFLTQMLKRSGHLGASPEPAVLSRGKDPAVLSRGKDPAVLSRGKDPAVLSRGKDPAVLSRGKDPAVSSRGKDPVARVQLSLQSLREVYAGLSEECGVSVPFSQLLEEVEMEAQQQSREPPGAELHLALSETPMEPEEHGSRYAGMTISRLVTEDDSQPSEDETQLSRPSPQRIIIRSDPESDDPKVQTVTPASSDEQRHSSFIIRSDPESDDPEVQTITPASSDEQRHSSGGGGLRSTPAHRSIPPAVRSTNKKAHTKRRMVVSSDEEFDPPSNSHTAGEKRPDNSEPECVLEVRSRPHSSSPTHPSRAAQSDHRPRVSSGSEPHSTRPQGRCRSSPADSGSSKRARWQDAEGTHEDWSDEDSLFSAASGPSSKKKYTRKLWTVQESDWLKEGVRRFGVGRWEQIRTAFPFTGRSACNLKDRWRTMVKLKMV